MFAGTGSDHEDFHAHTLKERATPERRRYHPAMGDPPQYPPYPPYPPGQPYLPHPPGPPLPSRTADRVVSILLLVVTALTVAVGAFLGLMLIAFLDNCPEETCSANGALISVVGAVGAAAAIGVAGLVFTSMRLSRRQTGWPFAAGTLALCVLALGTGVLAFQAAAGW